jgi:hypothetical protein
MGTSNESQEDMAVPEQVQQPKTQKGGPQPKTQKETPKPKTQKETSEPKTQKETSEPKTQKETPEPKTQKVTPEPKAQEETPEPKAQKVTPEPKAEKVTLEPKTQKEASEPKTQKVIPEPKTQKETPEPKTQKAVQAQKTSEKEKKKMQELFDQTTKMMEKFWEPWRDLSSKSPWPTKPEAYYQGIVAPWIAAMRTAYEDGVTNWNKFTEMSEDVMFKMLKQAPMVDSEVEGRIREISLAAKKAQKTQQDLVRENFERVESLFKEKSASA